MLVDGRIYLERTRQARRWPRVYVHSDGTVQRAGRAFSFKERPGNEVHMSERGVNVHELVLEFAQRARMSEKEATDALRRFFDEEGAQGRFERPEDFIRKTLLAGRTKEQVREELGKDVGLSEQEIAAAFQKARGI